MTIIEKIKFDKQPLLVNEQINLLITRGMIIEDKNKAANFLLFNNYYKFAGYWKKFAENKTHILIKEKNFDFFYKLYLNDKKLSHLILKYISILEDALKTQYAYHLSNNTKNSHPHMDINNFKPQKYNKLIDNFKDCFSKSPHLFKEHYLNKYEELLPPIWVLVENLTLGALIIAIEETKQEKIKEFFLLFNYKKSLLIKFLHSVYFVRNQCAHNSILWNFENNKFPELPNNLEIGSLINLNRERPKIIINFIIILHYLLKEINLDGDMKDEFNNLFNSFEHQYKIGYGIHSDNLLI